MTPEQYDRWKDFSLRMARVCYRKHRRPTARWIANVVLDFFDSLDEYDIPCLVNWDHSDPYPWCHRYGGVRHLSMSPKAPYGVDDMMIEFFDHYRGYAPRCRACAEYEYRGDCRCEDIAVRYYEQWDKQWGSPVCCCIRAGMDLASAPSAGVIGFTAGDVRAMFPEGVPDWVFPAGERLQHWPGGEENGLFVDLPDNAEMVL